MHSIGPDRMTNARPDGRIRRDAWLAAGLLAIGACVTALVDPARPGRYPRCPFRALTGFDCPGCGSLRALHQLTHGHLMAAIDYNLLFVAFLPCAAVVWLRIVTGRTRGRVLPAWRARAAIITLIVWTVVRNLPVFGGMLRS
ncbi:membrane protein [Streptomyces cellostaticus]|nr:membrane protein [Streptomyces cellostaticus]